MFYETRFLIALLATLLIEIPLLLFLVKRFFKQAEQKSSRIVITGLISSGLTLPYLWFVLPAYLSTSCYFIWGELLIACIEALIFYQLLKITLVKSFVLSVIVNAASFIIGLLLTPLLF